jgi:hypothetical protein
MMPEPQPQLRADLPDFGVRLAAELGLRFYAAAPIIILGLP